MVETCLLSTLNHQTLIATKAARVVDAAAGKAVFDFGARRAHGFDAALYGTRAAIIGGCVGTSNVLAGQVWDIPVYGTAAHSFTMAFEREQDAFAAFHKVFPESSTLLIDTYDTLEGARRAAALGPSVKGVRLDSGDISILSRQVRRILDDAGLTETRIVASGDLNEDKVAALIAEGAPIDSFGVGTEMIVSRDAPALGGVYKLVAIDDEGRHRPVRKLSPEKATYPDAKQVFRTRDAEGRFAGDVLGLLHEDCPGEGLLVPVMRGGELIGPQPKLAEIRERAAAQRAALPPGVRDIHNPAAYPVSISPGLEALIARLSAAPK
jgi:nicotinate phosphoribosyltransferase